MDLWRFFAAGIKLILRRPVVATTVIPVLPDGKIVLARRQDTGQWSLPGGILDWGEDLSACARRELAEETGFRVQEISRLVGVYSSLGRDPRFHSVTVAIALVVEPVPSAITDRAEISAVQPFTPEEIPLVHLSHDHARILTDYFNGRTVVA